MGSICSIPAIGPIICFLLANLDPSTKGPAAQLTAQPTTPSPVGGGPPQQPNPPPTPSPGGNPPQPNPLPTSSSSCGTPTEIALLDAINAQRAANGVSALACDDGMAQTARDRARLVCESGKCSHPPLRSPWAENLACGQETAESAVQSWMNSSGHKANMLQGSFRQVGVGYVQCDTEDFYSDLWIAIFEI